MHMGREGRGGSRLIASLAGALLLAGAMGMPTSIGAADAGASMGNARVARANHILAADLGRSAAPVCGPVQPGFYRCLALVDTAVTGAQALASGGYGPSDLQSAYNLPSSTNGTGRTVAVVDAYDDPAAAADLATYRSKFALPPCPTTNGCFRKVNQSGGTLYPTSNNQWAEEISLDLDMVSAVCPNCHILLVEASTDGSNDLGAAENEAAALHANAISNSYGGPEVSFESSIDHFYNHPGIAITAGSGDSGYGVNYPAASPYVTSVGGTSLLPDVSAPGWSETAWSGAGSGCSRYESQPSWETSNANLNAVCKRRAVADVSADADPGTPVEIYDSFAGAGGTLLAGGTSVSTPIIAAVFALTTNASAFNTGYLYSHTVGLNDVTSGSNGSCAGSALCTAKVGWDGPTGLGTPDGINAFGTGGPPIISAVVPAAGPVAGGQTVTVQGDGFAAGMSATIGGTSVAPLSVTAFSFQFVTPAGAAGYVQVQATTTLGTSLLTAQTGYIYTGLSNYVPLTPYRILDTRSTSCVQCAGGALGTSVTRTVPITAYTDPTSHQSVPSDATAVVINVTAVSGTASSLLAVYPTGTGRPTASNLNFTKGTVVPNLVTATLGQSGDVTIYNASGAVNVLADVEGYFEPDPSSDVIGQFHAIAPVRVCDPRSTSPTPACAAHGEVVGGSPLIVNVTGAAGIPGNGNAGAAVLNITGVAGTALTYLSVFPTTSTGTCAYTGTHAPPFSTLNLHPGQVEANRVMVGLGPATTGGPDTSVCVYDAAGTINVILDANGWFGGGSASAGDQYQAIGPSRICDTRTASGKPCAGHTLTPGDVLLVGVAGVGGVPPPTAGNPALAVIANLTAIAPTAATYLTIYPANLGTHPLASDINDNPGQVLPNLTVVQLDPNTGADDGDVNLFNALGTINVVIDIEGWFQ
jgi:IPT/TIG domain